MLIENVFLGFERRYIDMRDEIYLIRVQYFKFEVIFNGVICIPMLDKVF